MYWDEASLEDIAKILTPCDACEYDVHYPGEDCEYTCPCLRNFLYYMKLLSMREGINYIKEYCIIT